MKQLTEINQQERLQQLYRKHISWQMSQVANVTLRSTLSLNKTKENESTEIIFSFRERISFDQCRYVGVEHQVKWV